MRGGTFFGGSGQSESLAVTYIRGNILRYESGAATICRGEAEAPPLFRSAFPSVPIGRIVVGEVFVRLHPSPRLNLDVAVTGKSRSHFRPDVAVYRGMARRA